MENNKFSGMIYAETLEDNIEVILPQFPIRADSSYERFKEILVGYLNNNSLNENSIVVLFMIFLVIEMIILLKLKNKHIVSKNN